jgi:drug/metabolite transporter (DMT)-like permease
LSGRRIPWRVYLALIAASVLWGSLYSAAKPAVAATGPIQVTLCRVTLAFVCLTPLVIARRGGGRLLGEQLRSHWRGIAVLGIFNFGLSQMLALSAQAFLPASVNGVLNNTHPLWVAIGTAAISPPRRSGLLIIGSAVALLGVVLVFLPDLATGLTPNSPPLSGVGVALSLAGSGVIATGTVIGRRVMPYSDPIAISALASGVAILPVALLTLTSGGLTPILGAPDDIKPLLLYLGIGCTAMNFALWYYGLKHLTAAAASAFQYLIAPIGVGIAAVFLRESVTMSLALGTLFILIGLAATQIASSSQTAYAHPDPLPYGEGNTRAT